MSQSITGDKVALRKRMKTILTGIESSEVEEQSRQVTEKVLKLPAYENATAISIFLSMPGREISTNGIVLDALRTGKQVFIPYIHSSVDNPRSKTMDMLRLKDEVDLQSLKPDPWGIPSLSSDGIELRENALGGHGIAENDSKHVDRPRLGLIFMPGMAFDKTNNRLGHGKGFYDKYLSRLERCNDERAAPTSRPTLVGLALREQILTEEEHIPVNEHDWRIDQFIIAD